MAKTKKQLIKEREATFRAMDYDGTCWTCRYGWFYWLTGNSISGSCHAIEIRGQNQAKRITPADSCGLHERREET